MSDELLHKTFKDLVLTHGDMVGRIASTYEARPALCEELVQDSFLAVWLALPQFRNEASRKTFIARITHNVCISHIRKAVRIQDSILSESIVDASARPDELAEQASARRALLVAIRALPLRDRQLVSLHLEGFSNREVCEALGFSEGNVAVRLTRARERLKMTIGEMK